MSYSRVALSWQLGLLVLSVIGNLVLLGTIPGRRKRSAGAKELTQERATVFARIGHWVSRSWQHFDGWVGKSLDLLLEGRITMLPLFMGVSLFIATGLTCGGISKLVRADDIGVGDDLKIGLEQIDLTSGSWTSAPIDPTGYSRYTIFTRTIAPEHGSTTVIVSEIKPDGEREIKRIDSRNASYSHWSHSDSTVPIRIKIEGPVLTSGGATSFSQPSAAPIPMPSTRVALFVYFYR
jgi:hypothetical protein